MKKTAEWFRDQVFQDEPISQRPLPPEIQLPKPLCGARALERMQNRGGLQAREAIFIAEGRLLADYEDDYVYEGQQYVVQYYPTYESLSDAQLRGYFSWRTKVRRGDVQKTSLSFAFLYIYELINQIGVADAMDGYRKLKDFQNSYGQIDESIHRYLDKWLVDYVVYYQLDAELLSDTPQAVFDRDIGVLERVDSEDTENIVRAAKALSPKWLERSKFYGEYREDMDAVMVRVLRRVSAHYAGGKRTMIEQYFGAYRQKVTVLFEAAVFYGWQQRGIREYIVDERWRYRCVNGCWTVWRLDCPPRPSTELGELLKAIDAVMREEFGYGHPVKCNIKTKWLMKVIREEAQGILAEKRAAAEREKREQINIDFSRLARIREDAAVTQDKLTVEEELEDIPSKQEEETAAPISPVSEKLLSSQEQEAMPEEPVPEEEPSDAAIQELLSETEYRLLQCLLYGGDIGWVQTQGHMLSVLVDSINEKLYDAFMDSVLDDSPALVLVEDYIDELKEMIHP